MSEKKLNIVEAKKALVDYAKSNKYELVKDNYGDSETQDTISMIFSTNKNDGADSRLLTYFHINGWTVNDEDTDEDTFYVELLKDKEPLIVKWTKKIKVWFNHISDKR